MNSKQKAMLSSYVRALVAAALPVWVATGNWQSTLHALWAAAIPPIMRWANPQDKTMGRGSDAP